MRGHSKGWSSRRLARFEMMSRPLVHFSWETVFEMVAPSILKIVPVQGPAWSCNWGRNFLGASWIPRYCIRLVNCWWSSWQCSREEIGYSHVVNERDNVTSDVILGGVELHNFRLCCVVCLHSRKVHHDPIVAKRVFQVPKVASGQLLPPEVESHGIVRTRLHSHVETRPPLADELEFTNLVPPGPEGGKKRRKRSGVDAGMFPHSFVWKEVMEKLAEVDVGHT